MSQSPARTGRNGLLLNGLLLKVRLKPKSSADRIERLVETADGLAIAARVRAAPSDGEANSALERLVAVWLGVPKSCVALTAGGKSRIKTMEVSGEPGELTRTLAQRLAEQ